MNIYSDFRSIVLAALNTLVADGELPSGLDMARVNIERPKDAGHGELATNAAIVLARSAGMKPRDLAEKLANRLKAGGFKIGNIEIAGPGFLNIVLEPEVWQSVLYKSLEMGKEFGRTNLGQGKRVNLEFVSANPTGPLHLGHTRGAVFGDALGRLLAYTGHAVTREYYVNDGGAQVDTLARSTYLRYLEANGHAVEFQDDSYRGEYLADVGRALKRTYGTKFVDRPESEWLGPVRNFALEEMMRLIKEDLSSLDVTIDNYFHETSLYTDHRIEAAIDALASRGLIYKGTLSQPKGRTSSDWEPREQLLFRSTEHGDDVDRPIRKSDGSWTYFAPDIAYHYDKIRRGYDELINVFGADHGGYCKRLSAVVAALSDGRADFDIKLIQLVSVVSGTKVQKMSKRAGNFVQLREAIEAVGPDVTRFVMLMRRNDAPLDFDFVQVQEQSRENPVFYVQYAHARICSLLRRAAASGLKVEDSDLSNADLDCLSISDQITFLRRIADWPKTVSTAARYHEPHRIVFYLTELASDFHGLWSRGNDQPALRMLQSDDPKGTLARLALARSAAIVISNGLNLLGISPVNQM